MKYDYVSSLEWVEREIRNLDGTWHVPEVLEI